MVPVANIVRTQKTDGELNLHANPATSNFQGRTVRSIQREVIQRKIDEAKDCKLFCIGMAVTIVAVTALSCIPVFVITGGFSIIPFAIAGGVAIVLLLAALECHHGQKSSETNLLTLTQADLFNPENNVDPRTLDRDEQPVGPDASEVQDSPRTFQVPPSAPPLEPILTVNIGAADEPYDPCGPWGFDTPVFHKPSYTPLPSWDGWD